MLHLLSQGGYLLAVPFTPNWLLFAFVLFVVFSLYSITADVYTQILYPQNYIIKQNKKNQFIRALIYNLLDLRSKLISYLMYCIVLGVFLNWREPKSTRQIFSNQLSSCSIYYCIQLKDLCPNSAILANKPLIKTKQTEYFNFFSYLSLATTVSWCIYILPLQK